MAGNRQYVCNLWPELTIGAHVRFVGGFFQTADEKLQGLVESRDAFGTSIHYKDTIEVMEASSRLDAERKANDRARKRQEFLDALDEEDRKELGDLEGQRDVQRREAAARDAEAKLKAAGKVVDNDVKPLGPLVIDAPVRPADVEQPIAGSMFGGVVTGHPAPATPHVEIAEHKFAREKTEADAKKAADAKKEAEAKKTADEKKADAAKKPAEDK